MCPSTDLSTITQPVIPIGSLRTSMSFARVASSSIQEFRRRSLWQVPPIYVGGAWFLVRSAEWCAALSLANVGSPCRFTFSANKE